MPEISRASMSPREREIRSRINQIVAQAGLARGNFSVREKLCGKPNCRCAQGDKHRAVYLVASEDGRVKQLFIPNKMEHQTRECVTAYQEVRELLEELSQIHWNKLQQRKL